MIIPTSFSNQTNWAIIDLRYLPYIPSELHTDFVNEMTSMDVRTLSIWRLICKELGSPTHQLNN